MSNSSITTLPPISDLFNDNSSSNNMFRSSVLDIANLLSAPPATSTGLETSYHHHHHQQQQQHHLYQQQQQQQQHYQQQQHHHHHRQQHTHSNQRDLKAKRKRASPNQLVVLQRIFNQTYFPSTEIRIELGKQLGMSPRTVQIWFQNKRQALRSRGRHESSPPSFYLPPISPPRSPKSDMYSLPPLRLVPPHQQQYSPSMSYPSPTSIDHLPYRDY